MAFPQLTAQQPDVEHDEQATNNGEGAADHQGEGDCTPAVWGKLAGESVDLMM